VLTTQKGNLLSMSYVDLDEHLESIVGKHGRAKEAVDIRVALSQYPELQGFRHFTGEILLCSPEITMFCDDVLIQRYGKEFVAMPFTDDKGVRLHSNPVVFYIGIDNDNGFGIVPYTGWDEHFLSYPFDAKIVRKVKKFLDNHAPSYYL
jgi:hypothetical protein